MVFLFSISFPKLSIVAEEKRKALVNRKNNLQGGLSKLNDAANHVDSLSTDAEKKRKLVTEKKAQADQALIDIRNNFSFLGAFILRHK